MLILLCLIAFGGLYVYNAIFIKESNIILSMEKVELHEGEDIFIKADVIPQKSKYQKVKWISEDTLKNEIMKYSYQKKGLVAVNGGFFQAGWGETPGIPLVINKGVILRSVENKDYPQNAMYGCMGITKDGEMKTYSFKSSDYIYNKKQEDEIIKTR